MDELLLRTEYCRVVFELEFQEQFTLKQEMILRLRREFLRTARLTTSDKELHRRLLSVLDPGPSEDPYAVRLYQKPAPPFVIAPLPCASVDLDAGDIFSFNVSFFGDCGNHIAVFCELLKRLGEFGIYRGEGRFELIDLSAHDSTGNRTRLPIPDGTHRIDSVPFIPLKWYVESNYPQRGPLRISFVTPARLLSKNKPLFNTDFKGLFPFMLRRVTSMLHAWYGTELVDDAPFLIEQAAGIDVVTNQLCWEDWRILKNNNEKQDIGGIVGRLVLDSHLADELITVITLCSLFNVGKNAAYGCGHFVLLH